MAETITQFVREDFTDRSREAEQLLFEVCREGRTDLLTSERAFVAREMGWDDGEVRRQLRRVNSVVRLQGIAGRPEDREATLTECQVATDLLAKEGPKMETKIQELTAQLNGLRRDATTAQKRADAQAEAVQQLRQVCPQDIREQVQRSVKAVEAGIGQDLRTAKARHHELKCILNLDNVYESVQKHIEFGLRTLLPAAVTQTVDAGRMIRHAYSTEWPTLKAEHELEFAELSDQLPELQTEFDEAIRQAEQPLDYFSTNQEFV